MVFGVMSLCEINFITVAVCGFVKLIEVIDSVFYIQIRTEKTNISETILAEK